MSAENPFEHLSRKDLIAICLENRQLREQIAQYLEAKALSLATTNGGMLRAKDFYEAAAIVRGGL